MLWQFAYNMVFALIILLVLSIAFQINLPVTQELKAYLYFVVTTDFQVELMVSTLQQSLAHLVSSSVFSAN